MRGSFGMLDAILRDNGLNPVSAVSAMTAAPSPTTVTGTVSGAGICTSAAVGLSISAPAGANLKYLWFQVDGVPMNVSDRNAASVTFAATLLSGGVAVATWKCIVSNDYGQIVQSGLVTITLTSTNLGGTISGGASGSNSAHTAITVTSNSVTASATGGTLPIVSYAWSCTGGITADSPSSATTTFSSSLGPQASASGTATCTITDSASQQAFPTCTVNLSNTGWPTLTGSGGGTATGTVNFAGTTTVTTNAVTAASTGGQAPIGFSWSVGAGITVDNATSATTTFSKSMGAGTSASATATCTITSTDGQSTSVTAAVSLSNTGYIPVSATQDTTDVFGTGANGAGTISSGSATATGHDGNGSYTYSWARLSGSTLITANSPSAATSIFTSTGQSDNTLITAIFRCTVSDGTSSATVDVNVNITKGTPP